jgi:hypothetical protein
MSQTGVPGRLPLGLGRVRRVTPDAPAIRDDIRPLIAPGTDPGNVTLGGARRLSLALGVLRGVARTVEEVGILEQRRRFEAERLEQRAELLDEGEGSLAARTALPRIRTAITQGEAAIELADGTTLNLTPLEGETTEQTAERIVREFAAGDTEAFLSGAQAVQDDVASALGTRQEIVREEARGVLAQAASGAMLDAADPGAVADEVLDDPAFRGVDRAGARASLLIRTLNAAASIGDDEAFERVAGAMGDDFNTEIQVARATLDTQLGQEQREIESLAKDQVERAFSRLQRGEASFEEVRGTIDRLEEQGTLPAASAVGFRDEVERRRATIASDAVQTVLDGIQEQYLDDLAEAMRTSGDNFNLALIGDLPDPRGNKTPLLTREAAMEIVRQREFAAIDAAITDPGANLAAKVEYVGMNRVVPPEWERMMSYGATTIGTITETGEVPQSAQASLEFFRRVEAMNPNVARMVAGNNWEFLSKAANNAESTNQSVPEAIKAAARTGRNEVAYSAAALSKAIQDVLPSGGIFGSPPKNLVQARARLEQIAEANLEASGGTISERKAAQDAKKQYLAETRLFNGYRVDTRGLDTPSWTDDIGRATAETWADEFGERDGIRARDLTLLPDPATRTWSLVAENDRRPVDDSPVLTTQDLNLISAFLQDHERAAKLLKVEKERERRAIIRSSSLASLLAVGRAERQRFGDEQIRVPLDREAAGLDPHSPPTADIDLVPEHLRAIIRRIIRENVKRPLGTPLTTNPSDPRFGGQIQ